MLRWAVALFIFAIIAAFFGFTGVAVGAAAIAKLLFVFFLIAFAAILIWALFMGRRPPLPPV
jgi:uncharacterized membrane protein YtjA (UPF0391 family)